MMNRNRTYWVCQIAGWCSLSAFSLVQRLILSDLAWPQIAGALVAFLMALGVTHASRLVIKRREWSRLPWRQTLSRVFLTILVGACLMTLAGYLISLGLSQFEFEGMERGHWQSPGLQVLVVLNWTFIFAVWFAIYYAIHFFEDFQRTRLEKWQLEAAMKEAELESLKSQLNPHFLFNSLNNLRGLIIEDPARSQLAVTQLAGLLRYTLQSSANTVALEEELRAVRTYLELEAIRLEERLQYEIDANEESLVAPVPPMLIQSLVENGIKHGVSRLPEGGRLIVTTAVEGEQVRVEVFNNGPSRKQGFPEGVGLRNSRARLRLIYGPAASLELVSQPDGVKATVILPRRVKADESADSRR